jgi:hypothetical protein
MKHITKITAIALLVVFSLGHLCVWFVRKAMITVYSDFGGREPTLPVPTDVCLKLTHPTFLFALSALLVLLLAISEFRISEERNRLLVQIGCAALWVLFLTFCLVAFIVPLYIPDVVIAD